MHRWVVSYEWFKLGVRPCPLLSSRPPFPWSSWASLLLKFGLGCWRESRGPTPLSTLDRSQGRTANLQQKEFCLSLGHFNAFSSSDHVTRRRSTTCGPVFIGNVGQLSVIDKQCRFFVRCRPRGVVVSVPVAGQRQRKSQTIIAQLFSERPLLVGAASSTGAGRGAPSRSSERTESRFSKRTHIISGSDWGRPQGAPQPASWHCYKDEQQAVHNINKRFSLSFQKQSCFYLETILSLFIQGLFFEYTCPVIWRLRLTSQQTGLAMIDEKQAVHNINKRFSFLQDPILFYLYVFSVQYLSSLLDIGLCF